LPLLRELFILGIFYLTMYSILRSIKPGISICSFLINISLILVHSDVNYPQKPPCTCLPDSPPAIG